MAEIQVAIEALNNAEATGLTPVAAILSKLRDWRAKFVIGTTATSDERKKPYEASERAAREKLLGSSKELAELTELERKRAELERGAKAQAAKLEALFAEFSALPGKASQYRGRMTACAAERERLTETHLDAEFEAAYTALLRRRRASHD